MTIGTTAIDATMHAWNSRDRGAYLDCYAEGCELTSPVGSGTGREYVGAFYDETVTSFPDNEVIVRRVVAEGDTVVEESTIVGTNTGPVIAPDGSELPATGRRVELPMAGLHTLRDGRIVSSRFYWDNAAFAVQMGLVEG